MVNFFFQLGHCPDLSHAEILSLNEIGGQPFSNFHRGADVLLAESTSPVEIASFARQLGGTIRMGEWIQRQPLDPPEMISPALLGEWIVRSPYFQERTHTSGKRNFGLSLIGNWKTFGGEKKCKGLIHDTAEVVKNALREMNQSARFVLPQNTIKLSGAQIEKNKLLHKGKEFVFILTPEGEILFGLTQWIQPFEAFSFRDYGRPSRDAFQGMLPPKLARILINLARRQETQNLLDPFCGSGSLLLEASLMGLQATGFDQSKKAIHSCHQNFNWLRDQGQASLPPIQAVQGDARHLHDLCDPLLFDACVTEPYLGPPQRKPLNAASFKKLAPELEELYLRALSEIRTVVKPGARVVFIVPQFRRSDSPKPSSLRILPQIKLLGYRLLDPMNHFQPTPQRKTLLYSRPDQIVLREVFVLQA